VILHVQHALPSWFVFLFLCLKQSPTVMDAPATTAARKFASCSAYAASKGIWAQQPLVGLNARGRSSILDSRGAELCGLQGLSTKPAAAADPVHLPAAAGPHQMLYQTQWQSALPGSPVCPSTAAGSAAACMHWLAGGMHVDAGVASRDGLGGHGIFLQVWAWLLLLQSSGVSGDIRKLAATL
jgi:hypothetical protein